MKTTPEKLTRRYHMDQAADSGVTWDVAVIGGGATGAGIALDAALRGYSTILLESHDFGKGTSSRSTKLIHGGVRYLEQFQISMVRESLRERSRLLRNAPHLVHELEFIIPCRKLTEKYFYGTGLKLYDFLAASSEMPSSHGVSKAELYQKIPNLRKDHFAGGVAYSDGQFDDARLLIEIVRAAVEAGAIAINYAPVEDLLRNGDGKINGLRFCDRETGRNFEVRARCVVNATGPFCDSIRKLDNRQTTNLVAASQGVHLVLPKRFYSSSTAVIVPKTSDGRVLFIIPWHDFVVVGTTDTPIQEVPEEPRPFPDELAFLLRTMADYLEKPPTLEECTSVFTGVRPLVKASSTTETKRLSRDHTIELSPSGLMTITGGKWTTYRHMAEDCVDRIAAFAKLPSSNCSTKKRSLNMTAMDRELFQADASDTQTALERLHPELAITRRDLLYSIRFEFARTVEDLLARRTRALFIHSRAAVELAPTAANLLAQELGQDDAWVAAQIAEFNALARSYSPTNSF